MDSPCIKQTVCKVFKIFQCGKYLVAYVKSVWNKEHMGVICNITSLSNSSQALVLQDQCLGNRYLSCLDFTYNYEQMSGIFVPCTLKGHYSCNAYFTFPLHGGHFILRNKFATCWNKLFPFKSCPHFKINSISGSFSNQW